MNALPFAFGLLVGNLLYQLIFPSTPNYGYALTLTLNQGMAVLLYKVMTEWL